EVWECSRNSLCDPSAEAPSPTSHGSWRPIAAVASDHPSSRARAILEGLPKESGPWSSTEDCPRRRGVSSRSTKRDRAGLSDRVRSYFARPSSRAPPPRRPNVDLAHPARNERLHTGYERVIRLSFTKHNRCPRRHESINATVQLNIESDSRISGRRLRHALLTSSSAIPDARARKTAWASTTRAPFDVLR